KKGAMQRYESRIKMTRDLRVQLRCARQFVKSRHDATFPLHIAYRDRLPKADLLDLTAGVGEVPQVFYRYWGDTEAALGLRLHQPIRGQTGERLTHRPLADVVTPAQLVDPQRLAGFELAVQQIPAQCIVRMLGPACGGHEDACHLSRPRCQKKY